MSNGNKLSAFLRKKGMKKMTSGSSWKDFFAYLCAYTADFHIKTAYMQINHKRMISRLAESEKLFSA